jgi:hypothetical protein
MNILQQQDKDIILYGADDKHFGFDKAKFETNLQLSEHYNRGSDTNRTKEVVNLKDIADNIKAKLTKKEIFLLNHFAERKKSSSR